MSGTTGGTRHKTASAGQCLCRQGWCAAAAAAAEDMQVCACAYACRGLAAKLICVLPGLVGKQPCRGMAHVWQPRAQSDLRVDQIKQAQAPRVVARMRQVGHGLCQGVQRAQRGCCFLDLQVNRNAGVQLTCGSPKLRGTCGAEPDPAGVSPAHRSQHAAGGTWTLPRGAARPPWGAAAQRSSAHSWPVPCGGSSWPPRVLPRS